jgi:hypothetical protein
LLSGKHVPSPLLLSKQAGLLVLGNHTSYLSTFLIWQLYFLSLFLGKHPCCPLISASKAFIFSLMTLRLKLKSAIFWATKAGGGMALTPLRSCEYSTYCKPQAELYQISTYYHTDAI